MSRLESLKSINTRRGLARLLQFKPSALSYILFKQGTANKYKTFTIPKRKGGTRTIKAPTDALKLLQRRLSDLLQDCAAEINQTKNRKDKIAHGFKRQRSIITNARQHRNRRYVFNIDLNDFFPSINFGRVRGYFIRNIDFALDDNVATAIAQIACDDKALPQGNPCSPVISNLIANVLDIHLVRLASKVGCTYSRYADDLTFSTNKKLFPSEIAEPAKTSPHIWLPGPELQRIVKYCGFEINATKTRMQYRTSRQAVTGLVVNKRINVRWEYRHSVRAMVHSLFTKGSFEVYAPNKKTGSPVIEKRSGSINELHGRLGFIDSVDLYNQKNLPEPKPTNRNLSSNERMYREFLLFSNFYAASAPVILCEGETDNVYLTHAIRSLAGEFPDLATVDSNGRIRLKIRLYKYRQSSTARILELNDGGSSILAKFVGQYKKETDRFKAPGQQNPVIILYDNDSGAASIRKVVGQASGNKLVGTEPFVQVVKNLYAVPTPPFNGIQETKIEDFFDAATKAITIDNKTFNYGNSFDSEKHFGKKLFAHRVIRVKADTIDFKGFRSLLTNLAAVIRAHAVLSPATSNP